MSWRSRPTRSIQIHFDLRLAHAGIGDELEQALPLAIVQIVRVLRRAIADRGVLFCRSFARLRLARLDGKTETRDADQDDDKRAERRSHLSFFPNALTACGRGKLP